MPPFDGNLFSLPSPNLGLSMGDIASAAWRLPPMIDRLPQLEPASLSFDNIFHQTQNSGLELQPAQMEELCKNAGNIQFTSPGQDQHSGKPPDFFLNPSGKLMKNPAAEPPRPGEPLNIEVQANPAELTPELQQAIQSVLDTFRKYHPQMQSFPRTWEDAMNMLSRASYADSASPGSLSGDASGQDNSSQSGADSMGGGNADGGSCAGDSGGSGDSGGAGGGSSIGDSGTGGPIEPVNDLAPPIEADGKVFPVDGYHGGKVQLHHGSCDGAADIFAPEGTPVRAMVGGVVEMVNSGGLGGNTITIRQADGNVAYYAHMHAHTAKADGTPLKPGDKIDTGEVIGLVGKTGNAASVGSHLHIGVGRSIQNGAGPEGGAGTNFDLTDTLNAILGRGATV